MKKHTIMRGFILLAICLAVLLPCTIFSSGGAAAADTSQDPTLRILFTHDLHSNELPYKQLAADKQIKLVGGFARLKTAIDANRTDTSVLLDGGDFSQGSYFNGIFASESSELSLLGAMGYDATTLGNHEFDQGVSALAKSLSAASQSGTIPALLSSNIQFGDSQSSKELRSIYEMIGASTKIVEKNGVKIGVFGLMGKVAEKDMVNAGDVTFADQKATATQCVKTLKDQGADIIICLSHGGTSSNAKKSEDQQLAREVDGIDVIISGHTHTTLEKPITENGTVIVSCGSYGQDLGSLDIDTKTKEVKGYKLIPIDDSLAENADIAGRVAAFKADVQTKYLTQYGALTDEVVAWSNKNFATVDDLYSQYNNFDIGDLLTDALRWKGAQMGGAGEDKPIGIVASGIVRGSIVKGNVTMADVYGLASIGSGVDGTVGSPLVKAYVSGKELRDICQLDTFEGRKPSDGAQLFFSGMRYTYNDSRLPLNRVVDVEVQDNNGQWASVDDGKLYPVVTDLYLAKMMPTVVSSSYGLLSVTLKDKNGAAISDVSTTVLHDASGQEVKLWKTYYDYFKSFGKDANGVCVIPASYNTTRDTKTPVANNFQNFFNHTSKAGYIAYGAGAVLLVIIIVIIAVAVHHSKAAKATPRRSKKSKGDGRF